MRHPLLPSLIGTALFVAVWWAASLQFSSFVVPSPVETLRAGTHLLSDAGFWSDTLIPTLGRALTGGLIAAVIGVSLGLYAGHSRFFDALLNPTRLFLSAIPAPVFVILALLWVGARDITVILSVATMLVPLFIVAARDGLRGSDKDLLEMAQVYAVSWHQTLRFIKAPAVAISLRPAIRIAIANALRLTVLAEILVATGGLGEQISLARQYLETERLFAMIAILVGLIAVAEWLLSAQGGRR